MPFDGLDPVYMLSFDVEDWFQVERLRTVIDPRTWGEQELRVAENVQRLLALLSTAAATATFFVLGWIAERLPDLVVQIRDQGHEIASHGYGHAPLQALTQAEIESDVLRSKEMLEDITGRQVLGYRAPRFSVVDGLAEVLRRNNFRYDSSLYLSDMTAQYGKIELPRSVTERPVIQLTNGLLEVPVGTLRVLGRELPWGGGGYFRFYPYWLFRAGVHHAAAGRRGGYLFYAHPWEFDPGQPRVAGIAWADRLLHYGGLASAESKLRRLLDDFRFVSIRAGLERLGFV